MAEELKVFKGLALGLFLCFCAGIFNACSHKKDMADDLSSSNQADKWQITEGRSPMDDSKTLVLKLESEDVIVGPIEELRPSLILRCKEGKTVVYVSTGVSASVERSSDHLPNSHRVRTRIDNEASSYEWWDDSTDHKSLFADDFVRDEKGSVTAFGGGSVLYAKKLAAAQTFTFQFTPFYGNPQTLRFVVRSLSTHLPKLAEACGWSN